MSDLEGVALNQLINVAIAEKPASSKETQARDHGGLALSDGWTVTRLWTPNRCQRRVPAGQNQPVTQSS
jgi:hypothetical protein